MQEKKNSWRNGAASCKFKPQDLFPRQKKFFLKIEKIAANTEFEQKKASKFG